MCVRLCAVGTAVHLRVPRGSNRLTGAPSVEEIPRADSRNTRTTPQQQVFKFTHTHRLIHTSGGQIPRVKVVCCFSAPSLSSGIRAVRRRLSGLSWRSRCTWAREAADSLIGPPPGPDTSSARWPDLSFSFTFNGYTSNVSCIQLFQFVRFLALCA